MELKRTAEPREQILSLVMIMALFGMFFRVIYFPKRAANVQLNSQITSLRLERDALQKFTEALAFKLKESPQREPPKQLASKIRILKGEAKPLTKVTSDLLTHLTAPAFLRGLLVREMSDLPAKQEIGYQKAGFFINAEGTFDGITKYLERMDAMPVLLTIDNVSMKATAPKAARVSAEISGTLFSLGE